jgi:hypothetical protein
MNVKVYYVIQLTWSSSEVHDWFMREYEGVYHTNRDVLWTCILQWSLPCIAYSMFFIIFGFFVNMKFLKCFQMFSVRDIKTFLQEIISSP